MLNDAREALHCSYDRENTNQCFNTSCSLMREELRQAHDDLKVSAETNRKLEMELKSVKEQLKATQNVQPTHEDDEAYLKLQEDGRPRAGRVPSALAKSHHMVELMPGSRVFLYPKHIKSAQQKLKGTQVARFLMSVFYTNTELVDCGNLTGCHGKPGLDNNIRNAIIDYTLSIHGKNLLTDIKFSMRTKISALVSQSKKCSS